MTCNTDGEWLITCNQIVSNANEGDEYFIVFYKIIPNGIKKSSSCNKTKVITNENE